MSYRHEDLDRKVREKESCIKAAKEVSEHSLILIIHVYSHHLDIWFTSCDLYMYTVYINDSIHAGPQ